MAKYIISNGYYNVEPGDYHFTKNYTSFLYMIGYADSFHRR